MDSQQRIIKKYPSRRLYDTAVSAYITLGEIRRLVKEGVAFCVLDAKTGHDLTRSILLQVILEQEEQGQPVFSRDMLEQVIRIYGDTMHSFLASYLEESMTIFCRQHLLMQEQMAHLMESGPFSVLGHITHHHVEAWKSLQEIWLARHRSPIQPEKESS